MSLGITAGAAIGGSIGAVAILAVVIWWYADSQYGTVIRPELMSKIGVYRLENSVRAANGFTQYTREDLCGRKRSLHACGGRKSSRTGTPPLHDKAVVNR